MQVNWLSGVSCLFTYFHLPLLFLLNSGIGFPILEASSPMTRSLIGSYIWGLFDRRPMRGDEGIILAPEKENKKVLQVDDDGLAKFQPTQCYFKIFLLNSLDFISINWNLSYLQKSQRYHYFLLLRSNLCKSILNTIVA